MSICELCDKTVSAATTTNLRAHLQAKHGDLVLKELRANEILEVGKIATFATVKEDYSSVEKYTRSFKVEFVYICEDVLQKEKGHIYE